MNNTKNKTTTTKPEQWFPEARRDWWNAKGDIQNLSLWSAMVCFCVYIFVKTHQSLIWEEQWTSTERKVGVKLTLEGGSQENKYPDLTFLPLLVFCQIKLHWLNWRETRGSGSPVAVVHINQSAAEESKVEKGLEWNLMGQMENTQHWSTTDVQIIF